jgi:hypothetical protein
MGGAFNGPPKNPYYFEKARFNSDQMKDAKAGGGYLRNGQPVVVQFPWQGPSPDPIAPTPVMQVAADPLPSNIASRMANAKRAKNDERTGLSVRMKELGIKRGPGFMTVAAMREAIAEAEGKKAAE